MRRTRDDISYSHTFDSRRRDPRGNYDHTVCFKFLRIAFITRRISRLGIKRNASLTMERSSGSLETSTSQRSIENPRDHSAIRTEVPVTGVRGRPVSRTQAGPSRLRHPSEDITAAQNRATLATAPLRFSYWSKRDSRCAEHEGCVRSHMLTDISNRS